MQSLFIKVLSGLVSQLNCSSIEYRSCNNIPATSNGDTYPRLITRPISFHVDALLRLNGLNAQYVVKGTFNFTAWTRDMASIYCVVAIRTRSSKLSRSLLWGSFTHFAINCNKNTERCRTSPVVFSFQLWGSKEDSNGHMP